MYVQCKYHFFLLYNYSIYYASVVVLVSFYVRIPVQCNLDSFKPFWNLVKAFNTQWTLDISTLGLSTIIPTPTVLCIPMTLHYYSYLIRYTNVSYIEIIPCCTNGVVILPDIHDILPHILFIFLVFRLLAYTYTCTWLILYIWKLSFRFF